MHPYNKYVCRLVIDKHMYAYGVTTINVFTLHMHINHTTTLAYYILSAHIVHAYVLYDSETLTHAHSLGAYYYNLTISHCILLLLTHTLIGINTFPYATHILIPSCLH